MWINVILWSHKAAAVVLSCTEANSEHWRLRKKLGGMEINVMVKRCFNGEIHLTDYWICAE